MKITHLIGNGFDINIGLKTKYSQFLRYYLTKESSSTTITNFKSAIEKDLQTWSDFELRFGSYTSELNSVEEFLELFEDIRAHLGEYLQSELNKYNFDLEDSIKKRLIGDLKEPQKYLNLREQRIFEQLQKKYINHTNWTVNVITFNYTDVLDRIITGDITSISNILSRDISVNIPSVIHLHGSLLERLTFGVNDVSQIGNISMQRNDEISDVFVKPNFNVVLGHLLDEQVQNEINSTNIICLFGVSLGETDQIWWKMIGDKLKSSIETYLIFFYKSAVDFPKFSPKEVTEKKRMKNIVLSKIGINIENDPGRISEKVFVAANTEMLRFLLEKNNEN